MDLIIGVVCDNSNSFHAFYFFSKGCVKMNVNTYLKSCYIPGHSQTVYLLLWSLIIIKSKALKSFLVSFLTPSWSVIPLGCLLLFVFSVLSGIFLRLATIASLPNYYFNSFCIHSLLLASQFLNPSF